MYGAQSVVAFMHQELHRPSKQWIHHILAGTQEKEQVILDNPDFVLLPDTERVNRYWRASPTHVAVPRTCRKMHSLLPGQSHTRETRVHKLTLNWLAIVRDPEIRTLRDLRGHHAPMLSSMLQECMASVEQLTGIRRDQVMAYIHYPPSVYQLHIHFSYPYGQYCHRDAYRVHSLQNVINNLRIDSDYYAKSTLQLAMFRHSQHFAAIVAASPYTEKKE